MKNKYLYFYIFYFFLLCLSNTSYSSEDYFKFEAKNIEILDNGNLIKAYSGKALSNDENFEISGDNFQYFKNLEILRIKGNGSILHKKKKILVKFDEGTINKNESFFEAFGNVFIEDINAGLKIDTEKVELNYKENFLLSSTKSIINDKFNNNIITEKFKYEIQNKIIKLNNFKLTDKDNNIFELSKAYLNLNSNNFLGKDLYLELDNKSLNKENQPRLKGNSVENNDNSTTILGGVFTACKKRDGCPPWQISAKKIKHEKEKKIINYEDAVLKIYDFPVAYLPNFYHPDPTVDRQSGFLTPSFKRTSNKKNYVEIPYYYVLSDDKDLTLSTRLYNEEQILLQNQFRSVGKDDNHISEISLKFDENKKLKSHLFYDYKKLFYFENYNNNNFELKIQKTSKDTYLKKNKIKSDIVFDNNVMENSAKINFSKKDTSINVETYIFEDLNKNESDRFEYIFPKIDITRKIDNNTRLNGDFLINAGIISKNYNTNVLETSNINDLTFDSYPIISNKGFYNNYQFLLRNSNTKASNSKTLKNNVSGDFSGLLQLNSSMPLIKNDEKFTKTLNPKLSVKIAPNYTKNNNTTDNILDIDNIYLLNRYSNQNKYLEGGVSFAYGAEYSISDKKKSTNILDLKIANNLRLKKNDDLPKTGQFHEKISNIYNQIIFTPNDYFNLNYNSSIKNNLDDVNFEQLIANFKINNLITSFDYFNQNETSGVNSYLSNKTTLEFDESNSISFLTRKNKNLNLTEYYNFAYNYKNDCLSASIEYNKEYYTDRDIKPDEGIFLKFTIIPQK